MKKVLLSGHCNIDHPRITALLTENFDCQVVRAKTNEEALDQLQKATFDLVMVNRIGEFDRKKGMEIITFMQENESIRATPVMLISNLQESMQEAVTVGAVEGFGKAKLGNPEVIQILREYLPQKR